MRVQERGREFRLRHNLTDVLRRRGMTVAELSRSTGVAKQVLRDWTAGGFGDLGHSLPELRGRYEGYLKRIDDDALE